MPGVKEYQKLLEGACPWCGEALVLKKGRFGEFVACQDRCGYTKSVPGRSEYPPPKPKTRCPLKKCDGSGLIPFKRKDGSIVPFAWLDCECKEPARDHYTAVTASDFDFACSDTFRGYYHEEFDGRDPANTGSIGELPDITVLEDRLTDLEAEASFSGSIPRRYTEELQQVGGQVSPQGVSGVQV